MLTNVYAGMSCMLQPLFSCFITRHKNHYKRSWCHFFFNWLQIHSSPWYKLEKKHKCTYNTFYEYEEYHDLQWRDAYLWTFIWLHLKSQHNVAETQPDSEKRSKNMYQFNNTHMSQTFRPRPTMLHFPLCWALQCLWE